MEIEKEMFDKLFGFDDTKKTSLAHKIAFWIFFGIIAVFFCFILQLGKTKSNQIKDVKRKLRYFNPVISTGLFGKKITWVGREHPLTKDEVKKLF